MGCDTWRGEPGYLFRRIQQISMAIFAEECADLDITCLQYTALARIGEQPGIDVTRLSEIIEFDRSTLGGVVERLETKGYLLRTSTADDKRVKLLSITPRGRALLGKVKPRLARMNRRLLSGLSDKDQRSFLSQLSELVTQNADFGDAGRSDAPWKARA